MSELSPGLRKEWAKFQKRRRDILKKVQQINADVESYNANHNTGEPIVLSYDFTDDLADLESMGETKNPVLGV